MYTLLSNKMALWVLFITYCYVIAASASGIESARAWGSEKDEQLERRKAISQKLETLKESKFTGQIVTQWSHLIQRELRSLSFSEADRLAREWCFEAARPTFTSLVTSFANASIDAPQHVQFVTYHFSVDNTVAVAESFRRVLTSDADVLKRNGLVDVTLPGDRIVAKPRIEQLRFYPPVKLPVIADLWETAGNAMQFKYHSPAGKMTLTSVIDDSGFVSEWTKTPDGEQYPTEATYQSEPVTSAAGYFPRRAVRLRLHQTKLVDFTVNEILEVNEGQETPSDALAVEIPQGTVVIDSRDRKHPETAVAHRDLSHWSDAFDLEKNHASDGLSSPMRTVLQGVIVIGALVGVYVAMRVLRQRKP